MSTAPRNSSDQQPPPMLSGEVLACPRCGQEMAVPSGETTLPLHMDQGAMCLGAGTLGAPPKFGVQIREPLTIPDVSKLSVSEVLSADTCLSCGGPKSSGQTLCTTCHGFLSFLIQKCLPTHVRGYLYVDEKSEVAGIDKNQFMEVFQSALTELAQLRAGGMK